MQQIEESFLQRELYIALAVMGWCARVCVCNESAQSAGKMNFAEWIILDWGSTNCQNGVCDLDLENEVKVPRSQNFNWPYLEHFSTQDQNIECSVIGS